MNKSNSKIYINEDGTKVYTNLKEKYHRLNGPAIEWKNGDKEWWEEGKKHREDGPAIEWSNGSKFWYIEGKLHRTDGLAAEFANGNKYWYILDKLLKEKEFNSWINRIKAFI